MSQGIVVLGLGPGDPNLLTREAWDVLRDAEEIYLRTRHHPAVAQLPSQLDIHSFDEVYEGEASYEAVYRQIAARILELGRRPQGVVYAVPGDPTVGEASVAAMRAAARAVSIPFRLVHGVSFIEPCLAAMGLDALDGLCVADALALAAGHHPPFPPDEPTLIGQLYSRQVAGDVKLTLMNQYPDDHEVALIHAAGTASASVEYGPLHAMDQHDSIGPQTTLFVPPLPRRSSFEAFQETVAHLRAPNGCPWDRQQTHQSLREHLLEETYEALTAIDRTDVDSLREELGDLLLQIVLQAQIATEAGEFAMPDVIAGIQDKIWRRHPHVFGDLDVTEVEQVLHNWETLKASERENSGSRGGLLDGVPLGLPALAQAGEIQARVARVGFDWPSLEGVIKKVEEEMTEVAASGTDVEREGEIGDLLFAVVNYSRWLKVDPESALRRANHRFRERFGHLENAALSEGRSLKEMDLGELDSLWEAAKGEEE